MNSPPAVSVPSNTMSEEEEFKANVQDIFFDYDTGRYPQRCAGYAGQRCELSWQAIRIIKIVLGGYCDERGSDEYNLALGQNRANTAAKALGGCREWRRTESAW